MSDNNKSTLDKACILYTLFSFCIGLILTLGAARWVVIEASREVSLEVEGHARRATQKLQDDLNGSLFIVDLMINSLDMNDENTLKDSMLLWENKIYNENPIIDQTYVFKNTARVTGEGNDKAFLQQDAELVYQYPPSVNLIHEAGLTGPTGKVERKDVSAEQLVFNVDTAGWLTLSKNLNKNHKKTQFSSATLFSGWQIVLRKNLTAEFEYTAQKFLPGWLQLYVYIHTAEGGYQQIFGNIGGGTAQSILNPVSDRGDFGHFVEDAIAFGEIKLSLLYRAEPGHFPAPGLLPQSIMTLTAGAILTFVLCLYVYFISSKTRRIEKEAARHNQEANDAHDQMNMLLNSIHGVVWECDATVEDLPFTYINEKSTEIYGYSPEQLARDEYKQQFMARFHEEDAASFVDLVFAMHPSKKSYQHTHGYRQPSGQWITLKAVMSPVWKDDQLVGIRGVSLDITEQIEQEKAQELLTEEVADTKKKLDTLISSIDGVVWERSAGPDGLYTYVSIQAEDIFGIPKEELINVPNCSEKFILPEDLKKIRQSYIDHANDNSRFSHDFQIQYRDEGTRWIRSIVVLRKESNGPGVYHGVSFDVSREYAAKTEHKEMESQLRQSQKLEAVGQLAAGIAHEINTPAQFVGDNINFIRDAFEDISKLLGKYSSLLERSKSESELAAETTEINQCIDEIDLDFLMQDLPSAIEQSLDGVSRISTIVKAMKEFSHPGGKTKELLELNRAIESTITVARNEWKYVAEMETDFDENLPAVPCMPGEFNQTILNMLVNAAHAIEHRQQAEDDATMGKISVRTRLEGQYAVIRISDSGMGISDENLQKIFDPFFTTKQVGKGTGQGLAIAHSVIVDKHDGKLSVESEVGKGTCFTVMLPLLAPDMSIDEELQQAS